MAEPTSGPGSFDLNERSFTDLRCMMALNRSGRNVGPDQLSAIETMTETEVGQEQVGLCESARLRAPTSGVSPIQHQSVPLAESIPDLLQVQRIRVFGGVRIGADRDRNLHGIPVEPATA